MEKSDALGAMNTFFYDRAYSLISLRPPGRGLNIDAESAEVRDAYGRNEAGQRMLMARRRLVAAGVRLVTLTYGGWDMHNNIVPGMKSSMPALDQGFAQLINDLDQQGLLDETLVMVSSEFGRTPKINGNAGRDHWPKVQRGVGRRRNHAGTDLRVECHGQRTERDETGPADSFTTVYYQLGIIADKELMAKGAIGRSRSSKGAKSARNSSPSMTSGTFATHCHKWNLSLLESARRTHARSANTAKTEIETDDTTSQARRRMGHGVHHDDVGAAGRMRRIRRSVRSRRTVPSRTARSRFTSARRSLRRCFQELLLYYPGVEEVVSRWSALKRSRRCWPSC
ncbi:MAG: DUF1501 domain-containing protein [Pirellulales bacterium]